MMLRILGFGSKRLKTLTSNPVSLRLRPLFEHKSAKNILGLPLLAMTLVSGALNSSLLPAMGVINTNIEAFAAYDSLDSQVITKPAIAYPIANALGVSQGYHVFHPALDIRAPRGSDIHPIASGVVKLVVSEKYGYGKRVEVDHEDGHESLYAHMDSIAVQPGDEVTIDSVLGTIGMTGHTTGPHLHIEIRDEGRTINPLTYLARKTH